MLEPLSVALHAVKRSGVKPGDTAAVIGTGMIGFAAAAWAKALGAETVFRDWTGRSKTCDRRTDPGHLICDGRGRVKRFRRMFVVEAVGNAAGRFRCSSSCKTGRKHRADGKSIGRSCDGKERVLAHPAQTAEPDGNWNSSYEKDEACDWTEALDALSKKKIPAQALITHCFPSEKLMDGLELMKNHKEPYCKVMVSWE